MAWRHHPDHTPSGRQGFPVAAWVDIGRAGTVLTHDDPEVLKAKLGSMFKDDIHYKNAVMARFFACQNFTCTHLQMGHVHVFADVGGENGISANVNSGEFTISSRAVDAKSKLVGYLNLITSAYAAKSTLHLTPDIAMTILSYLKMNTFNFSRAGIEEPRKTWQDANLSDEDIMKYADACCRVIRSASEDDPTSDS